MFGWAGSPLAVVAVSRHTCQASVARRLSLALLSISSCNMQELAHYHNRPMLPRPDRPTPTANDGLHAGSRPPCITPTAYQVSASKVGGPQALLAPSRDRL